MQLHADAAAEVGGDIEVLVVVEVAFGFLEEAALFLVLIEGEFLLGGFFAFAEPGPVDGVERCGVGLLFVGDGCGGDFLVAPVIAGALVAGAPVDIGGAEDADVELIGQALVDKGAEDVVFLALKLVRDGLHDGLDAGEGQFRAALDVDEEGVRPPGAFRGVEERAEHEVVKGLVVAIGAGCGAGAEEGFAAPVEEAFLDVAEVDIDHPRLADHGPD